MYSASYKINLGSSSMRSSKDFGLKKGKLTGADDFYIILQEVVLF